VLLAIADRLLANLVCDHLAVCNRAHRFLLRDGLQMHATVPATIKLNGVGAVVRQFELVDGIHHRIGLRRICRGQPFGGQKGRAYDHGQLGRWNMQPGVVWGRL